jgi:leucyl-tRNA---protein transferase
MELLFEYLTPPSRCSYLPDRLSRTAYEIVGALTPVEYAARMRAGWRRFGHMMFRPQCGSCTACQSIRLAPHTFRPNRSQRRCHTANTGQVRLVIGKPSVTDEKLNLYDRFHWFQSENVGWTDHGSKDASEYVDSFVNNPFPVEEWCYYIGTRLVGVGYVDTLPVGLSAIYFYHEPEERKRSLGTWNVLNVIAETARRRLNHTYLGYFVEGCRSLEYKATFGPNEVLTPEGAWVPFRE